MQDEVVLTTKWFTIRKVTRAQRGKTVEQYIIDKPTIVMIIPYDSANIYFVKQYRLAIKATIIELPAGGSRQGENELAAARRELKEETGLSAKKFTRLQAIYPMPGLGSFAAVIYLAEGLAHGQHSHDADEQIDQLIKVPVAELPQRIREGQFKTSLTLAALNIFLQAKVL